MIEPGQYQSGVCVQVDRSLKSCTLRPQTIDKVDGKLTFVLLVTVVVCQLVWPENLVIMTRHCKHRMTHCCGLLSCLTQVSSVKW